MDNIMSFRRFVEAADFGGPVGAFLAHIEEEWPYEEAIGTMNILADWLEEHGQAEDAAFFRSDGSDFPRPFEVHEVEQTVSWPEHDEDERDPQPDIDYDVLQDDENVSWEEVVNDIKKGGYNHPQLMGGVLVMETGDSQDPGTGNYVSRNMRVSGVRHRHITPLVQHLLMLLTTRR